MAPSASISDFRALLSRSNRILALCGAGLSASSGLPTFRGSSGLWRTHQCTQLATPEAFEADPGLVWLFYAWRRHLALSVKPNAGHHALAALARSRGTTDAAAEGESKPVPRFMCLTQNVDGLAQRAGHPTTSLRVLHGSLLTLRCAKDCGYEDRNNLSDPPCPALKGAAEDYPVDKTMPLLDPAVPLPQIDPKELPQCPRCEKALLRPGVVWFGEELDQGMMKEVDEWIGKDKIDIVLVVGTAAAVYPAAGYVLDAVQQGAAVVIVNPDPDAAKGLPKMKKKDFFFQCDAAEILPLLFEDEIGKEFVKV